MNNVLLYYIFFALLAAGKYIEFGADDRIYQVIAVLAFITILSKIITTQYTVNELKKIIIIAMLCIGTYFTSGKEGFLFSALAIVGIKNVSTNKIYKLTGCIGLIIFGSKVLLSSLGIIEQYSRDIIRYDGKSWMYVKRIGLGYEYSNIMYVILFTLICIYIYIYYDKLNNLGLLMLFSIFFIVYKFSYCRTGFMCGIILLLLIFLQKNLNIFRFRIVKLISSWSYILCFAVNFLTSYYYEPNNIFFAKLNSLLSGRLALGKQFLDIYKIKLFGQKIVYNTSSNDYMVLDATYINMLLSYGLVATIIFLIVNTYLIRKLLKHNKIIEVILLVSYSVYGLSETFLPNLFLNMSMIFLSELLYPGTLIKEKNK